MIRSIGSSNSPIMIIFDHATAKDAEKGALLSGPAGPELKRMCKEAGLEFGLAYVTSVVKAFPPKGKLEAWLPEKKKDITEKHTLYKDKWVSPEVLEGIEFLWKEIEQVKPRVIVAMGAFALWLLTEKEGLKTYRGSILRYNDIVVIPTYPPSLIFAMWSQRAIAVQDLRRAAKALKGENIEAPNYQFQIRPTFKLAYDTLTTILNHLDQAFLILSVDIETRLGHIVCIAFSLSRQDAICIPLVDTEKGSYPYWLEQEEIELTFLMIKILTHTNSRVIWQNGLYDAQYIYKAWHCIPNHHFDTMLGHHVCFTTMQKSLDFLASFYCDYYSQYKGMARELTKGSLKKDD